jgi:hypothetical protein
MEKENEPRPSYYAVIPATVRYHKKVPAGAKLLYGEISSLCNKKGCCWAGNAYFAELYQTSERTVINWINILRKYGYISVSFSYVPGKKEIQSRFIRLAEAVLNPKKTESEENTAPDTASNPDPEVVKITSPRGENIFTTYGKNFHEVVKNPSKGGENNFTDNIKNNIKNTTTTPEQPDSDTATPHEDDKAAAAFPTPDKIKTALTNLDGRLFFDASFYPKAAAFLVSHKIDLKYIEWLHEQCEIREPDAFDNYYFSVFFLENKVEQYKALNKPSQPPQPPDDNIKCPVCGAVHNKNLESCPDCSLPKNPIPLTISLFRELLTFPVDRRNEYLKRENIIYSEFEGDSFKIKKMIDSLKNEFGLTVNYETPSRSCHL